MDPFAKYLSVAKTKLDLSNINSEDDIRNFCISFLEKKGYYVGINIPSSITPTYPKTLHESSLNGIRDYNYSMQVLTASYVISRDTLELPHNVQGLKMQIENKLYTTLVDQIEKMNITKIRSEKDMALDQIKYTMQLGVFKP